MTDTVFDTKKRVEELEKELAKQELLAEASNEAINYTLELMDNCLAEDVIPFLQYWNEDDWPAIKMHYSDFDLTSEAQQALIKESGGMPT